MDYTIPKEFESVSKESLQNSQGVKYKEYRRSLEPRYGVVWRHILSGYAVLLFVSYFLVMYGNGSLSAVVLSIVLGSFLFGYTIAFLQLFFHEAAHYNLAAEKTRSDLLSNILIGAIVGQDIKNYRPIHWDHHRFLGTTMDTEHSYFDPLDTKFIVESLFGIRVLKVLSKREQNLQTGEKQEKKQSMLGVQLVVGLLINGAIVVGGFYYGKWVFALAWFLGMIVVFPFFASVRQVLEHRDEHAKKEIDYFTHAHGVINRMFGDGIIADTLGGAGFNRHLLHHWDPQLSYTRLRDLEEYLMDTPLASALEARQTTYIKTFIRLFNS